MKKFILIFFLSFLLIGCNNKNNDSKILNELLESISIPTETDKDLVLPTSYEYKGKIITAIWKTEDTKYISTDGTIYRDYEDNFVSLCLTLFLNESQITKYFDITILAKKPEEVANNIFDSIDILDTISDNIQLPSVVRYNNNSYKVNWESSDPSIISSLGKITYVDYDRNCVLTAAISVNKQIYSRDYNIKVSAFNTTEMNDILNVLTTSIPNIIENDLSLPNQYKTDKYLYNINWLSSDNSILSNEGSVGYVFEDTSITLKCMISIGNITISKDLELKVLADSTESIFEKITNNINIFKIINSSIYLPTKFGDYITCTWESSNPSILTNDGIVVNQSFFEPQHVSLTSIFKFKDKTMTKEYQTIINPSPHFFKTNVFDGDLKNLQLTEDGSLVLTNNSLYGTFTSKEFSAQQFTEAVASWNAITSKDATCELLVSLRIDGVFSEFISYGKWGLGLNNKCVYQKKDLIELDVDEIKVLKDKSADGFKFKVILERETTETNSPSFSLFAIALNLLDSNFSLDIKHLKQSVLHDVPRLYQYDVPSIGDSICSPSSSTMLLKYAGYSFSDKATYEHEYIANLAKDYGNDIFGNWVYNTVCIGSFGLTSYVKRFIDTNEFLYSIQENGPMAASIKGTVKYVKVATGESGSYTSGGHLLVVTGYEILDGQTYVYINDPAVKTVATKMTIEDFLTIWRNVSYIIDK